MEGVRPASPPSASAARSATKAHQKEGSRALRPRPCRHEAASASSGRDRSVGHAPFLPARAPPRDRAPGDGGGGLRRTAARARTPVSRPERSGPRPTASDGARGGVAALGRDLASRGDG
jgi:hypothetical protein